MPHFTRQQLLAEKNSFHCAKSFLQKKFCHKTFTFLFMLQIEKTKAELDVIKTNLADKREKDGITLGNFKRRDSF